MDDLNEAKKLLEEEKKARVERCQKKIQQALTDENCLLDATVIVSRGGVFPQINIIPNDER
jgi:hypothetical protein